MSDNGTGMTKEVQTPILTDSHGLGLSTVYGIVKAKQWIHLQ